MILRIKKRSQGSLLSVRTHRQHQRARIQPFRQSKINLGSRSIYEYPYNRSSTAVQQCFDVRVLSILHDISQFTRELALENRTWNGVHDMTPSSCCTTMMSRAPLEFHRLCGRKTEGQSEGWTVWDNDFQGAKRIATIGSSQSRETTRSDAPTKQSAVNIGVLFCCLLSACCGVRRFQQERVTRDKLKKTQRHLIQSTSTSRYLIPAGNIPRTASANTQQEETENKTCGAGSVGHAEHDARIVNIKAAQTRRRACSDHLKCRRGARVCFSKRERETHAERTNIRAKTL